MPREVYPPPRAKSIEHVIQVSNCLRTVVGSESPRRATTGRKLTLVEIADELCHQLTRIFLRDKNGRRPDFGACEKMQTDPHFRDYVLFLNDERSRDNSSLFWRDTQMKNAART